jgi:DNA-binding response OmpR family regulator
MDTRRMVALVVDDNEPTRLLLARILEQELGMQSVLAGTCEEALRLAKEREFDIILLDLVMPGIGGFEVLKGIRMASANVQTPVIVLSVLDDKASVERCMALKAHAFITKPVNRDIVAGMVKAQLRGGASSLYPPWQRDS